MRTTKPSSQSRLQSARTSQRGQTSASKTATARTATASVSSAKKAPKPKIGDQMRQIEAERSQDSALSKAQILAYYRSRADVFDSDRQQLYTKLEAIRIKQDIVHKTEWELKKRRQEKQELEQALERCQQVLHKERSAILSAKQDSDNLRVKQRADKKDILDMLARTNSVEQHVYYSENQAPEKINHFAPQTMEQAAEAQSLENLWRAKQAEPANGVPRVSVASARS